MEKVQKLEREVAKLSSAELAQFRQWFADFDAEAWDRQIEADAQAGKLNPLADRALRDHQAGKSTRL